MVPQEIAKEQAPMNLSFAGCGFLGIYHVGVASCIQKYAPQLYSYYITGASAGSLVAAGMLCGLPLSEAATFVLNLAAKARRRSLGPLHPQFNIVKHLKSGLEVFLPDDAHIICSGRLFVSLTRVHDRRNVLMSDFHSKEDLIQCLLCSAHVPFWSGVMPPMYRGERYIDGGLSLNNPILNENTITVSPFAGESDICPDDESSSFHHVCLAGTSIQLNSGNLYRISNAFFPPIPETLSIMCKQGYDDALKFLQKSDLISCTKHLSVSASMFSLEQLEKEEKKLLHSNSDDSCYDGDAEKSSLYSDSSSEEDDRHFCHDCRQKKESLSVTSLPTPVVQALQAACDSVNKGLMAAIYKMRIFKVVSLVTAPWVLPLDVGFVMIGRFYKWLPFMSEDMQWAAKELLHLLKVAYDMVQECRHHYSARFACQLAVTDVEMVELKKQLEAAQPAPVLPPKKVFGPVSGTGQSVNYDPLESLVGCADELRRYLEADHLRLPKTETNEKVDRLGSPHVVRKQKGKSDWIPQESTHAHYDSYENCLHVVNEMDSILTYHYMKDDDDPEIFRKPTHEEAELAFDNFIEKHKDGEDKTQKKKPGLRRCMSEVMTDEYLMQNEAMARPRATACALPAIKEEHTS